MAGFMRAHLAEAMTGLLVVGVAAGFLLFAMGSRSAGDRVEVTARFPNVSGVNVGTDVKLSGMKVGSVTAQTLDPATYQAVLTLAIDPAVKLPMDSSAAITSDGLLGGAHIALVPGAEAEFLKAGDEITDTQGATDLMGLIGSFINRGSNSAAPDAAAPAPATAE